MDPDGDVADHHHQDDAPDHVVYVEAALCIHVPRPPADTLLDQVCACTNKAERTEKRNQQDQRWLTARINDPVLIRIANIGEELFHSCCPY